MLAAVAVVGAPHRREPLTIGKIPLPNVAETLSEPYVQFGYG